LTRDRPSHEKILKVITRCRGQLVQMAKDKGKKGKGKNRRISWDEYFMNIAEDVALRSTCLRRQIGAVIVDSATKEILASGYNGNPRGQEHCTVMGCIRDIQNIPSGERSEVCTAVHAEQNALMQAGTRSRGATMYCLIMPCNTCAKMIVNAGIKRVVFRDGYPEEMGKRLLEELGVEVLRVSAKRK
jgi:dCMP deaminase